MANVKRFVYGGKEFDRGTVDRVFEIVFWAILNVYREMFGLTNALTILEGYATAFGYSPVEFTRLRTAVSRLSTQLGQPSPMVAAKVAQLLSATGAKTFRMLGCTKHARYKYKYDLPERLIPMCTVEEDEVVKGFVLQFIDCVEFIPLLKNIRRFNI